MCLAVEFQTQFPIRNVTACAVEGSGVLTPLGFLQHEVCIRRSTNTCGTGNHIQGIIIVHLPQVMNQQDGNAVLVCQRFQ